MNEQNENWYIKNIAEALEGAWQAGRSLTKCADPGHRFGIKIDWSGISVTECGCYDEAVWPQVLTLGVGEAAKKLSKKATTKISRYLTLKSSEKLAPFLNKSFEVYWQLLENFQKAMLGRRYDRLKAALGYIDQVGGTATVSLDQIRAGAKNLFNSINRLASKLSSIKLEDIISDPILYNKFKTELNEYLNNLNETTQEFRDLIQQTIYSIDSTYAGSEEYRRYLSKGFNASMEKLDSEIEDLLKPFEDFDYGIDQAKQNSEALVPLLDAGSSALISLLEFVAGVLSYITIVVDKECSPLMIDETFKLLYNGPTDHRIPPDIQSRLIQIIDSVFFQGQWKGGSWDGSIFYPIFRNLNDCKIDSSIDSALGKDPSWKNIQQVLIDKRLPIWPKMNNNCECSTCPPGYELCSYSALINGWSDTYNICLPVCGGQGVQPIQIGNMLTKANCDVECPDGYMWVKCFRSECDKSPCRDGSDKGFCVKMPDSVAKLIDNGIDIKYGKFFWDITECKWVCWSGRWIMDWTSSDGPETEGPVYSDDPRFDKKIFLSDGDSISPQGRYVPAYEFRADRYELYEDLCEDPFIRNPMDDCNCSGSYDNIGIPEVPPGYVLYDGDVIPLADDDSDYNDDDDDTTEYCLEMPIDDILHSGPVCETCITCSDNLQDKLDSLNEDLPYKICPKTEPEKTESEQCSEYDYSAFTNKIIPYNTLSKYDQNNTSSCGSVSVLTQFNQFISKHLDKDTFDDPIQIDAQCLFATVIKFLNNNIDTSNIIKYKVNLVEGSGRNLNSDLYVYASFDPSTGKYNTLQTRRKSLHPIVARFDPTQNTQIIDGETSDFYYVDGDQPEIAPPIFNILNKEESNAWRDSNAKIKFEVIKQVGAPIDSRELVDYLVPFGLEAFDNTKGISNIDCRTFGGSFNDILWTIINSGISLKLAIDSPPSIQNISPFEINEALNTECDDKQCIIIQKTFNNNPNDRWPVAYGAPLDTKCPADHLIKIVSDSLLADNLVAIGVKGDFLQQLHLYQLGLNDKQVREFFKEHTSYEDRDAARRELMLQYEKEHPLDKFPEIPPGSTIPKEDIQHWSWDSDWLGDTDYFKPIPDSFELRDDPNPKDTCSTASEDGTRTHWMAIYGMEIFNKGTKSEYIKFYVKNSLGEPFDKLSFIIMKQNITATWPFFSTCYYPDNDNEYTIKKCE